MTLYICILCRSEFKNEEELERHYKGHDPEIWYWFSEG